ncbi:MAG: hypothetical protein F6J87_31065, partial [Spirulina sp. SIO3F2]|nr:hypothetical protein [Spirulina sp. SIO3F2]
QTQIHICTATPTPPPTRYPPECYWVSAPLTGLLTGLGDRYCNVGLNPSHHTIFATVMTQLQDLARQIGHEIQEARLTAIDQALTALITNGRVSVPELLDAVKRITDRTHAPQQQKDELSDALYHFGQALKETHE